MRLIPTICSLWKDSIRQVCEVTQVILGKEEVGLGQLPVKPPIGLRPAEFTCQSVSDYRIEEIQSAIQRYGSAGKEIPAEWLEELNSLKQPITPEIDRKRYEDQNSPEAEFTASGLSSSYILFSSEGKQIGKISWTVNGLEFEGDASESAKLFITELQLLWGVQLGQLPTLTTSLQPGEFTEDDCTEQD